MFTHRRRSIGMENKLAKKAKVILSVVFGCLAATIVVLCGALFVRAFLRTPFTLANSIYDANLTDYGALFNLIATGAAGMAEIAGMLITLLFGYICSWISLGFGTAALILSFDRCYKGKIKILGRITGIIGMLYGLFAIVVTVSAFLSA